MSLKSKLARVLMLVLLLAVSGMALGLVFAYPVSKVQLSEAAAIELDQANLAGKADPEQALVSLTDLGEGWSVGDAALAQYGILGSKFCGDEVKIPTALSPVKSAVYTNPSTKATVVAQAVRLDRWQNAREYVSSVDRAVGGCDRFYTTGPEGRKLQRVLDSGAAKPIDDHVARVYLAEDGASAVAWSVMSVGDVVVAIEYFGPSRPPEGFLGELESKLLLRLAPDVFTSDGGSSTDSSTTTTAAPAPGGSAPPTSVVEGGSADESGGGG